MAYEVYVTKVKNIRPAENADRLNLCEVFGNTTVIDKTVNENDLYLYFPVDGQISVEYGEANNLFRKKDDAGNNIGGFIDPEKRRITALRLRGNRSDGLVMPLKSLETFGDISTLKEGDRVATFNGHEIACKYVAVRQAAQHDNVNGNRTRKKVMPIAPLFTEHADTEQLAYHLSAFKAGDEVEISLKMHGTSQRTAYVPVFKGFKRTLWDKICRREGTPIYEWGYVSGTRRVVLEDYEGGFYGSNEFRERHSKKFEGKLHKGETVYYEVVGFTSTGAPIMGDADNKKLNDKEFVKQYGPVTTFSYGCEPDGGEEADYHRENCGAPYLIKGPQSEIYVYRMTMTNEDGDVVEYTPDFMRYRCEQMDVKCVPVFWKGIIPEHEDVIYVDENENDKCDEGEVKMVKPINAGEWIQKKAEEFYDGPDPVGKTHVREGVVVRITNRPKFTAYKHKNFSFKVLSGIAIAQAEESGALDGAAADMIAEM
jgi:hypothetical protein